ncbi:MAG: hypothetical protein HY904_01030 [Deltaproteobacteria bacterium]|nr:hypothetical protein [Deltaproteobacteria bacterium]
MKSCLYPTNAHAARGGPACYPAPMRRMAWWWWVCLCACGPGGSPGGAARVAEAAVGHRVTALALSDDGARVAIGLDGALETRGADLRQPQSLAVGAGFIQAVAFNAAGTMLFSGGQANGLTAWNTADGSRAGVLTDTVFPVRAVACSPAGLVVAALGDNTLRVFSPLQSETRRWLQQAAAVRWWSDQEVVSGGADGLVRRFDPVTGNARGSFSAHLGGVLALDVDAAAGRVASAGGDGLVRVSALDGTAVAQWDAAGIPVGVAFVDGDRVACVVQEGALLVVPAAGGDATRLDVGGALTAMAARGSHVFIGTLAGEVYRYDL